MSSSYYLILLQVAVETVLLLVAGNNAMTLLPDENMSKPIANMAFCCILNSEFEF